MRILLVLLLISTQAFAYQSSETASGNKIRWNATSVPVRVINNSASLPSASLVIDASIAEWNAHSPLPVNKVSNSTNQIRFENDFSMYGSAVVGLTEVSYNPSGTINTAVIKLNEHHFDFTATPGMPSGNNIYLKDVVTHELGHFLGLGHSEVLNSSMFYSTYPGQSELSADDKAAIKHKYGGNTGTILGHIKGGNHVGILGAHVQAISRKSGESIGAFTDEDGYFEIGGLNLSDGYYLYTSPIKKLDSLPGYFANVQSEFCPGSYVGSFFSACGRANDGYPQEINFVDSSSVDVGEVTVNCALRTQENYNIQKIQTAFSPMTVYKYSATAENYQQGFVGFHRKHQLKLPSCSTPPCYTTPDKLKIDLSDFTATAGVMLKLKLVSQVLGNTVEYQMVVKNGGAPLMTLGKTFNPEGTHRLDLSGAVALSANPSNNKFDIEIQARKLTNTDAAYSIPDVMNFASNENIPYLLIMSLENVGGMLASGPDLSDNYSCLDAPFTYAVEKATFKSNEEGGGAQAAAAASCATIEPPSGPGPGTFMLVASLGFMLSLLSISLPKKAKKFLS